MMNELAKDAAAIDVTDLLTRYSFDLGGSTVERLVNSWLHHYPTQWLRLAVIEALYQGRYKAFSVEQILNLWKRRGRSLYRFNHEFERIVCGRFPTSTYGARSPALNSVRSQPFHNTSSPSPPPDASAHSTHLIPSARSTPEVPAVEAASEPLSAQSPESEIFPPSAEDSVSSEVIEASDSAAELMQDISSPPKGSPVPTFKPASSVELGILEMGGNRPSLHREPIHQFTPTSEASDFYSKLRAVAQMQN